MWTYEQTTGRVYWPDGHVLADGYSGGNCGKNPEGINNHEMQNCHDIGPIPVGFYTMGEMIAMHPNLGPFVIPLVPDEGNEMFGRSLFRIHGDTVVPGHASEGCIILNRVPRLEMAHSEDRRLQVIARVENTTV